jgi:hypothetical protein
MSTSRLEKIIEHDAVLVETVQSISILNSLAWPQEIERTFLDLPITHK